MLNVKRGGSTHVGVDSSKNNSSHIDVSHTEVGHSLASLATNNFHTRGCAPSPERHRLDNLEVLNRLNGNYNSPSHYSTGNSCFARGAKVNIATSNSSQVNAQPAKLNEASLTTSERCISIHNASLPSDTLNSRRNGYCLNGADSTVNPPDRVGGSGYPLNRLRNNLGVAPKVSNTTYQYHLRRQQRNRKFRLNLFMYSALYRKQKKIENYYVVYHNPMEDPDATYTSFSNPNYVFSRAHHRHNHQHDSNDCCSVNGNASGISVEKLSLSSDLLDTHGGAFSDYSSCEPTPTTPDRSLVLQRLHSLSDDDTDDDDIEADGYAESVEGEKVPGGKSDSDSDGSNSKGEPRIYFGVGAQECRRSRGILGYLEMLEKQAMKREARKVNGSSKSDDGGDDNDDDDEDRDDKDEIDSPKTMNGGDSPIIPPRMEKYDLGTEINSPDSNDSGIQAGDKTPILSPETPGTQVLPPLEHNPDSHGKERLPEGWQKHEDEDGPYYWHVKSGTIQRHHPPPAPPEGPALCSPRPPPAASEEGSSTAGSPPSTPNSVRSSTERLLAEFEGHALQYAAKSLKSLSTFPEKQLFSSVDTNGEKFVRFAVRSLGWVKIAEEDLTPERSSKAVNKCIVDLSLGRNDINDAVGRWGDGKDLFMDLDYSSLRLVDPNDGVTLNTQPIHSIRVWGVGRDNGRDFAYVARDRGLHTHMCHVFHCDMPARQIANTLRDICKKIMLERSLHQSAVAKLTRPTDLPNLDKVNPPNGEKLSFQSHYNNARFPTPMEEPRKVMRCHYLGPLEVLRPTGRDVLNEAIQSMYYRIPPETWKFVNVAIAPSTITITEYGNPDGFIEEFRVRFLAFMGIAVDNVKLCAFIMHTSQNKFICHVFHCEPSAGPMCKTIEAACKLRYQKCLDAHPQTAKGALQGKSVKEVLSAGVKAGVQGLKEVKSTAVQSMMGMISILKGIKSTQPPDS